MFSPVLTQCDMGVGEGQQRFRTFMGHNIVRSLLFRHACPTTTRRGTEGEKCLAERRSSLKQVRYDNHPMWPSSWVRVRMH